jgi:hypothetical protein
MAIVEVDGALQSKSMLWYVKPEGNVAESPLGLVTVTVTEAELWTGVTATSVEELVRDTEVAPSPPKVTDTPV